MWYKYLELVEAYSAGFSQTSDDKISWPFPDLLDNFKISWPISKFPDFSEIYFFLTFSWPVATL